MFDYLDGKVAQRGAVGVTLEVGGVGYHLLVPLGTSLPAPGARARVWTHLVVREDAHTLYGFVDRESRELFRALLRVKGVGPGVAMAVLSGLSRHELVAALLQEDLAVLTRVKGVGKKTAEQILLDLRDRAPALAAGLALDSGVVLPAAPPDRNQTNFEDAAAALVALGFSEKDAKKRVEKAAESVDPADLQGLVQAAFRG